MRRLVVAIAVALLWAAPAAARPLAAAAPACVTFTGATSNWNAAGNWSTGALPGPGDDVCIPARFPIVTIGPGGAAARSLNAPATSLAVGGDLAIGAGGATVAGLDVTAGTLASAGPLAATSVNLRGGSLGGAGDETIKFLGWFAGTLSGPGTTTVTSEADLGAVTLGGRTLRLAGTTTLAPGGKVDGGGALVSTGTLHANGATIAVPLTNDGTVAVDGGVLTLTGGGAGGGGYAVAAGAVLDWARGAYALAAPLATGAGTFRVSGATVGTTGTASLGALAVTGGSLSARGPLYAGLVSLSGGTLGGTGDLGLAGLAWSGGVLAGSGTTTVGAGGLAVGPDGAALADGTLVLSGDSTLGGPLTVDGRLENAGVLTVGGDTGIAGSGLLVNRAGAVIRKGAGAGVSLLTLPVDNDGLLDARSGTLRLGGGSGIAERSTGSYAAAAGAQIDWRAGTYSLVSPSFSGPGSALVTGGSLVASGPARFPTLVVSAGGAQFDGTLTADTLSLGAATLSGAEIDAGRLLWSAGTLAGGTATVGPGGLLLTGTATKTLRDTTLELTGDSTADATERPLVLTGTAEIRLAAALDVVGGVAISGPGSLTVTASGTLRKSGAGTADLELPVDNQGTLDAAGGELRIASLAGYDAGTGVLRGGIYDLAGTLTVPGADVAVNAAALLRLEPHGALSDGAADGLAHLATNAGILELSDSRALAGGLANTGTVRISGATLMLAGAYVQTADGRTILDGGTLQGGSPAQLADGRLEGSGTVAPGLRNAATVAPSAPLTVAGDYVQTADGVLAAPGGSLAVAGTAALDGTLLVDPYAAAWAGRNAVPMLTAGAVTGRWTLALTDPIAGATFDVDYDTPGTATLNRRAVLPPPGPPVSPDPGPTVVPVSVPVPVPVPEPTPVAGKSATAAATGSVLVQVPGRPGGFVALGGTPTSLPAGTVVDARAGRVNLTAASSYTNPKAPPTEISVAAAIFRIRQERAADGHTAVTDLVVQTPPGAALACAPRKGVARAPHRTIRRIRARVRKGVVRTLGAAAVLTTRKATFSMTDRCDGTSTRLTRGKGTLFNRVSGRRARLRASRRAYFVRTKLFTVRQARLRKIPKP